ncbi:DUF7555 family protein [Halobacterium sp. KA-6]|uniref:DUF7555 family protein n=1 Tax=Halobacterium sp. KA-6 TaxID=2896368 RepID=UPI001E45F991|nr:hypothetical protein [Halobacterium sp. KA-6]MCD2203029.1 hypothetical protein [Halobacterium sp. KA-6]
MNRRVLRLIEFVYWVLAASVVVLVVAGVLGFAAGNSLVTVKYLLFVVGFLLFGIGAIGIRPAPAAPHKEKRFSPEGKSPSGFETWIQQLPPLNDHPLRFADRISRSWKLLVTSLIVLGVSLFLELGLGVTASAA